MAVAADTIKASRAKRAKPRLPVDQPPSMAKCKSKEAHLRDDDLGKLNRVLDFGLSSDELADLQARTPRTVEQIAALIVSEDELHQYGRWRGAPQPPWRRLGRLLRI